ncbi:MAG: indolepyruvate ferredoxin oxidoreductase family protein [Proteobacteria bacterium]|nr:indolepyruvate ferredoxin oxidoreductase family protein [Pseudomonadota bacterium]
MALLAATLDDKYALESGRVFLTGTQALVRLPMMQRRRDEAAGLNTACFISGYRGSPLGGYDMALWRAGKFLKRHHIYFQPGLNEDLGATAVWGSQQVNIFPGAKYDGVFSIWYGKGPGVARSMDPLIHGNMAGASRHGGALVLLGDDHASKSSTLPHQSEHLMIGAMIPVLNPSGVQEVLDYGLLGWAMSRYSGCWVSMKCIADTMDASASVYVDPHRVTVNTPNDFEMPEGGVHIRWPDDWNVQEFRLHKFKAYAALAFARANQLDRIILDSPKPRFGIITTGKSYLDVREALDYLGIGEKLAAEIGIRVYKVGMSWPLEREGARHFAEGLQEVMVVEEKRAVIENQLKEQLYNWRADVRPRVVGKFDEKGEWILPSAGEFAPAQLARVIARRLQPFFTTPHIEERLAFLDAKERQLKAPHTTVKRTPYFCSGCPHNTSTRVPEGSRAAAGIGCHYMAVWMDRETATFTHMGGEGAQWIGQADFTETKHIFQNIGDGTYTHSGSLAIRAAMASGVNITYKILYNDAVAMTGGQPAEGGITVPQMARQVAAEGVARIAVVSDEPDKYPADAGFPAGTTVHHRDALDAVQRELRDTPGVTAMIYDQTCAAEKRRRRKRGTFPDPDKRVLINELVCEGCGDCGVQSNCLSVAPVETEFGRKRTIDQSSCNKDFSCLKGFCPSFVTVHGGRPRRPRPTAGRSGDPAANLPAPKLPSLDSPYNILVTGIGGTGVVTIGALVGMAAHLEGKGCSVLDMTGLAQKGGAVLSHIRVGARPEDLHAVRVSDGDAHLLLGCDIVVGAGDEAIAKLAAGTSRAVVNTHETLTGAFTRNPDFHLPLAEFRRSLEIALGPKALDLVDATDLATSLLGDSIATNLFMLGFAYQKALIPVSAEAIEKAIELNAVSVEMNTRAFRWGRAAAHDRAAVERAATPAIAVVGHKLSTTLDEIVARRIEFLTAYQNAAYAGRYQALVRRVAAVEAQRAKGHLGLAEAVARYYFKLLAYKDEYEVARLYTDGTFHRQLAAQFEGDYRLEFNLAPPAIAERDPRTGHLIKRTFGPWMLTAFRVLAQLKFLRGTRLDIFGRTAERQAERRLISEYEALVDELTAKLDANNHGLAVELAALPEQIRGYGHIKDASIAKAKAREAELLACFRNPAPMATAAE